MAISYQQIKYRRCAAPSVFLWLMFSWCTSTVSAQNNTSPYSILGIGDIENHQYGRWSGMGNAGTAMSSNRYLNQANVASLSWLDNEFFVFEISGRYKYVSYTATTPEEISTNASDINMQKIALGTKVTKNWGLGVGLNPYSTSNYSFYSKKTIQGTTFQTDVYNQGSGGLNQFYLGNSYLINKNISLGAKTGFIFGSLTQEEDLSTDITITPVHTTTSTYLSKAFINYGLQYKGKIGKKLQLSLGGTYAAETTLKASASVEVTENEVSIVSEDEIVKGGYKIPQTYSAGIALMYNNHFTVAGDYRKQNWSSLQYKGYNYALINSQTYAMGFEYSNKVAGWGTAIEKSFVQAGFFYNEGYLQLNKKQLNDYGFTVGVGGNSKRNSLGYQVSLEVGSRGSTDKNLIKENYSQITFTLSYRDFWFTKGRKYD